VRSFREKLRARLHAQIESERWKVLLRQRKLIDEYTAVVEQLRTSDMQIARLVGPPPNDEVCPQCHYCSGAAVELRPEMDGDRVGSALLRCPDCGLVAPPTG
jgi:hypothetical protein